MSREIVDASSLPDAMAPRLNARLTRWRGVPEAESPLTEESGRRDEIGLEERGLARWGNVRILRAPRGHAMATDPNPTDPEAGTPPMREVESDAAFVDQLSAAIKGDRAALAAVLKAVGPGVRARIEPQIGVVWRPFFDVDDVMQVTYLEAFLSIGRFTDRGRGRGAFVAWLTQMASNNLRDAVKELERAKRPDPHKQIRSAGERGRGAGESRTALVDLLGVSNATPSQHMAQGEIHAAIERALQQLPPDYAQVIRLCDLEGHSAAEVGARLNRTSGAIYMLLSRARERLGDLLGSESQYFTRTR